MKKTVPFLFVISLVLFLHGCSSSNSTGETDFYGTWKAASVDMDGSIFTIAELEAMGDFTMSNFYLVIKDGGKTYVAVDGDGELLDWKKTGNSLNVGIREFKVDGDSISLDGENGTVRFEKVSESQDFSEIITTSSPIPTPTVVPTPTLEPTPIPTPKVSSDSFLGAWEMTSLFAKGQRVDFTEEQKAGQMRYLLFTENGLDYYKDDWKKTTWTRMSNIILVGNQYNNFMVLTADGELAWLLELENNYGLIIYKKIPDSEIDTTLPPMNTESASTFVPTPTTTPQPSSGVRPEFQEAMNSYEKFFDEYAEFMQKYKDAGSPASMYNDYLEYMNQYTKTMNKLNEISGDELSSEELKLYAEVTTRISQKLMSVATE